MDSESNNKNPQTDLEKSKRVNYEILPIGELRKQAKKLMIDNYLELNKQKLIEAIRNAKNSLSDF